jgi:hypothetical protein
MSRALILGVVALWAAPSFAADTPAHLDALKQELRAHLAGGQTPGTDSATRQRASLARLRNRAADFTKAARAMYGEARPNDYLHRWGLVHTMGELGTPAAIDALAEIATAPLPAATVAGNHETSPDEEEAMIRMRAVAGLGRLAGSGDRSARAALERCAGAQDRAVRATAVFEWIAAARAQGEDDGRAKAQMKALLPAKDAWMLELRHGRLDVEGRILASTESAPQKRDHEAGAPVGR